MDTILAKKSDDYTTITKNDDHHEMLANDPTINDFSQSNAFSTTTDPAAVNGFGISNNNSGFSSTTVSSSTSSNFGNNNFNSNTNQQNYQSSAQPGLSNVQITQNQGESLKNTGGAMQDGGETLIKNDNTDWVNKKWRPMMGWIYMATCTCDFVIFPILWSVLQALSHGQVTSQWQPLTLQGAGLYHIAMGAVLGIAAYGRTKEKVAGAAS
jgi:uncharacterized membrane protein YdfJ with MMPL/SSD domain